MPLEGSCYAASSLCMSLSFALQISQALKALYDEDIVEEDLILAWADKPVAGKVLGIPAATAKAVREAASKFVEWLKVGVQE